MAKFIGRRVSVGIALESTRGTVAVPTYVLGKTDYNLDDKANKAVSGEGVGSISGNGCVAVVTGKFAEGSVEFEIGAKSLPAILKAVVGGSISSSAQGTGYKHSLSLLESNQHPTLSVTLDDPNGDVVFAGAMVDSFDFSVGMDEIVKASMSLKAKVSKDTVYTASPECDFKFVGRDLTFKVATDIAGLAGATALSVKELSVTVTKNSDYDWVLGTLEPEDIVNKQFTIEGKLTLNYEDRTWRNYMLDGSYRALSIKLEQSRDQAGDQNPTFYIELPKVHFSEWESQRGNEDIVGQTINFSALYDTSTEKLISDIYVVNNITSY